MESLVGTTLQQLAVLLSMLQASLAHDPMLYVLFSLVVAVWGAHFALARQITRGPLPVENRDRERRR